MKEYKFRVSFDEGRWCDGFVTVNAQSREEAEIIAAEYIGTQLYKALPELGIEFTWECVEERQPHEVI